MFVCMLMCIKGCLFPREIQFEESNLIRGRRSLTGQRVLKWVTEGPGWLLLPQKGYCNGAGRLTVGTTHCNRDADMVYLNGVCATVCRKI